MSESKKKYVIKLLAKFLLVILLCFIAAYVISNVYIMPFSSAFELTGLALMALALLPLVGGMLIGSDYGYSVRDTKGDSSQYSKQRSNKRRKRFYSSLFLLVSAATIFAIRFMVF